MHEGLNFLEPTISPTRTVRGTVDVTRECHEFARLFDRLLIDEGVQVEVREPVNQTVFLVQGHRNSLFQLLHILAVNSLQSMSGQDERRIRIRIMSGRNNTCCISFMDRGPGIPEDIQDTALEAGVTGRDGARGMGLTLSLIHISEPTRPY